MKKKLLLLSVFAAVVAIAGLWSAPRTSEANTFNPFFGPTDFYSLSDTSPGGHADVHAQFNVNLPSANFSGLFGRAITFGDPEVFSASAAQIPGIGAYMGQLQSTARLGLANESCSSPIGVTFNFVEANVDTSAVEIDTPPGDGNPATSNDPLTLAAAINTAPAPGTTTVISYGGASGTDPLGVRLDPGTPPVLTPVNEIQIDSEQMQIVDVDYLANTYTVKRGWNGTTPATHTVVGTHILRVNVIYPSGPNDNLLANMAEDDGDMDNNGPSSTNTTDGHGHTPTGTGVENADYVNQVSDGADAGEPSFVRNSYDPDGNPQNGGAVTPLARYYGVAFVANTLIVTLQFVIAAPGALTGFPNLQWATAPWGYSSTTFLQDPLAPPSNSSISDFCNFVSNTTLFGIPHDNACTGPATPPLACTGQGAGFTLRLAVDAGCPSTAPLAPNECGLAGQTNGICPATTCPRSTNPVAANACNGLAAGWTTCPVKYYQYAVSQRDYDNDGHDNALDVCFNVANPSWDPRSQTNLQSGGDADGDGLPTACDPNDNATTGFNNDQDVDAWQNRIDNCPLIANTVPLPNGGGGGTAPNAAQFDLDVPSGVNVPDGGPASDSIGFECDNGTTSPCSPAGACTGTLDPNGANGRYHATAAAQTICIGTATIDCSSAPGAVAYSPAVTLTNAITNTQNQFNYTSAGDPVRVNDIILVESERMIVSNVDTAANQLTVARGQYGTAAAAHNAGIAVTQTGDNDNDGVVNASDTCVNGPNPPQLFPGPDGQDLTTAQANSGTSAVTVSSTSGFSEGSPIVIGLPNDGKGGRETLRYINTGGVGANTLTFSPPLTFTHAAATNVAQVSYAQPLFDYDNDGSVSVTGDIATIGGVAFSVGGDPGNDGVGDPGKPGYQGRYDINNDGTVDVTGDISVLGGSAFQKCGPG